MASLDIVVISSRSDAVNNIGPDGLDGGETASCHDVGCVVEEEGFEM